MAARHARGALRCAARPETWEGSPASSWGDDPPPAVSREWPSSSGGPIYAAPSPGGPFDSRDSAEALPGGLGSATASTGGSSNTKAVVAGVVGGLAGVLVAGLAAGMHQDARERDYTK